LNGVAPSAFAGPTLPSCPAVAVPFAINNAGQITGWSQNASGNKAFLYSGGVMTDIGAGDGSRAFGISSNGYITGQGPDTAFVYMNGVATDIGSQPGFTDSRGLSINSIGKVVGLSWSPPAYNDTAAFLWSNGQFYDLNTLVDPSFQFFLYEATSINDAGQIIANGCDANSNCGSFLLTEVPEPEVFPLYGIALTYIVVRARRKAQIGKSTVTVRSR
jgi:probable HAF family extracellular repeat protein